MHNNSFRKIIKIKLLTIKILIGSGLVHVAKHDPHIHFEKYRKKYSIDNTLVIK